MELEVTVKLALPLENPPAVRTTALAPVDTPDGTVTTTVASLQPAMEAEMPPIVTVPVLAPKLPPDIASVAPIAPVVGSKLVMVGTTLLSAPPRV